VNAVRSHFEACKFFFFVELKKTKIIKMIELFWLFEFCEWGGREGERIEKERNKSDST